ncbi:uncharacterized protein BDW43DRAFT_262764 [Aspergillus alliaceus]|uniref:uncharacterized protein n=1 Tax=Petromyces alliaceus TaxID=209559 RepID=UPI0012A4C05A|nr:uncharacterized protein BDW43DRAFT_262764 [Aspergillus alliaceus]KAB8237992.1 hypothetical protein BDW43DRAFT_262764 [Aspergillus alliaceus]
MKHTKLYLTFQENSAVMPWRSFPRHGSKFSTLQSPVYGYDNTRTYHIQPRPNQPDKRKNSIPSALTASHGGNDTHHEAKPSSTGVHIPAISSQSPNPLRQGHTIFRY